MPIYFLIFYKKYKNVKYLFIEFIFKIRNKISNFRIKYFNLIYAEIGKGTEVIPSLLDIGIDIALLCQVRPSLA